MKKIIGFGLILCMLSGCSLGASLATSAVTGVISTGFSVGKGAISIGGSVATGTIDLFTDDELDIDEDE